MDSQESGDVDWLALPVAKPREEKLVEEADKPLMKANKKYAPNAAQKEGADKKPTRSFDDEPVGVHNWHPNPDEERPQVASFGGRAMANQPRDEVTPIDDLPIKPAEPYGLEELAVDKQRSSNLSEARSNGSHAAPKGYDFEKMIEVAMQKFGEAPAVMAPEKPGKSPTASGLGAAANPEGPDKAQAKEKDEKEVKVDAKKKALLEKRKKYDPRAAIKKSKQQNTHETATTPQPDDPGEAADEPMPQSRNTADRPPASKSVSELPETEETQPAGPTEEQIRSQPPRPYLKRKTKAVKVEKGNQYKVEGKSRIDCWQKGDKEGGGNTVVYGNRKRKRQSLLKKNQESRSKLGWSNEGSPSPGARRQTGERSAGTSPAPFRRNQ